MTDITPKQAQELLEGTTPAPWEVETVPEMRYYDGETWETPGKIVVHADEEQLFVAADEFVGDEGDEHDNEKNVRLAAAAPTLARMVAGMQLEYIFQEKVPSAGPWKRILSTTTWPLDHCQYLLARMQSELPKKEYRLTRRLVSNPEEIS